MTTSAAVPSRADRLRVVAWPAIATLVIALFAFLRMWQLAIPVPEGTVCAAVMPPPAGCAGDARIMPATVWSAIVGVASIVTIGLALSGRATRQVVWIGVALTGALALFGLRDVEHLPGM
ncbi:hypothetical protein [Salinibacterium sp. ZJ70]|uniref:hypothetical protein n=1 Tax=Salinibacterium sp. ZJ70 TaxID=2708084 RepID=UPI001421CB23|nr:hypothetical protein [Salinibacterium sp. ZJ70]